MKITTFYRPEMSVQENKSFSPSAGKPQAFIEAADKKAIDLRSFEPVTAQDLALAHNPTYVKGVLSGRTGNGFGNRSKAVAEACTYTVGSLVAATRYAAKTGEIVCSPTSGFHHATYNSGGGFCTFNGLAVAAIKVLQENPKARIAILDCDYHYGNGTDDILQRKPHLSDSVLHFTAGQHFHYGNNTADFFDWLNNAIDAINDADVDVLIYQAGGDMHIDDPLGGLLSTGEMAKRDLQVFQRIKCGIAWNLAGGYQRDADGSIGTVLQLHLNTLTEARLAMDARQGECAA